MTDDLMDKLDEAIKITSEYRVMMQDEAKLRETFLTDVKKEITAEEILQNQLSVLKSNVEALESQLFNARGRLE